MGLPRAFVGAANYRDWVAPQSIVRQPRARPAHRQFQPHRRRRAGAITGCAGYRQPVHGSGNKAGRWGVRLPPHEEQVGHEAVVILSDAVWARRFGRDPGVIGGKILQRRAARDRRGDAAVLRVSLTRLPDLGSLDRQPRRVRDAPWLQLHQRRPPASRRHGGRGVSRPRRDRESVGVGVSAANRDVGFLVQPMGADLVRDVSRPLLLLLAGVAQPAVDRMRQPGESPDRSRRVSQRRTRASSSARCGQAPLVRQSLTELLPLLVIGGLAGVVLARLLLAFAVPLLPATMPRVEAIALDLPVSSSPLPPWSSPVSRPVSGRRSRLHDGTSLGRFASRSAARPPRFEARACAMFLWSRRSPWR